VTTVYGSGTADGLNERGLWAHMLYLPSTNFGARDPAKPAPHAPFGSGSDAVELVKHEHHANSAEEGDTANIKQNTTNKGFFRGRRLG
jgi:hypothetical protein